jgi:hypothetical protein
MDHPLLYEINSRCWLRELSTQHGRKITLANVPPEEIRRWGELGFTHIWLMGVWTTGPLSRNHAFLDLSLRATYSSILPGWKAADVAGSPYAIADYVVPRALGGEAGLRQFRKQLNDAGMRLVLDFVPNHAGLDHAWTIERPELFVRTAPLTKGAFRVESGGGSYWLAHGRDPNFPPWTDTVQFDFRRPDTREAIIKELLSVAARCDGLRCDMAMLALREVFARTWSDFPCPVETAPQEFWAEAMTAVKAAHPGFQMLAEAYWGLEPQLLELGFNYTYDKPLYDRLLERRWMQVQESLVDAGRPHAESGVHFLENHDEARIATRLLPPEHRAALLLIMGLPGLRLLHDGQMEGHRVFTPVQLARRAAEPTDAEVAPIYQAILAVMRGSAVGHGEWRLPRPHPAWNGNPTHRNFVTIQWQSKPGAFDLVVVNLACHPSQCFVPLEIAELGAHSWKMADLLGEEKYVRAGADLEARGLFLDVPPHAAQLFHFEHETQARTRVGDDPDAV